MKRNNVLNMVMLKERRGFIASCAFLLGFISAAAQVILMRELMSIFSGHELVFAVVLGVWLLGIALGSAWAGPKDLRWTFGFLVFSVSLIPLIIVGIRFLKPVLGIPLGGVSDIGIVVAGAAFLLLPLTVVLGAVFAGLSGQEGGKNIYAFEALGFVGGGILITFIFFIPLTPALNQWSQQAAWPGYRLVASEQTPYGSIVVLDRGGQKSFFENGRHLFTQGDVLSAEEVHVGLLVHPAPRAVFLMGGGLSQAAAEVLKHPLQRLDYVQLDPDILRVERREVPVQEDPRLHETAGDPRAVLERSTRFYDVIVMNEGDPLSLLSGRFFTREFFAQARAHLGPGGILAVTISSSENYVNVQGKAYARSVKETLSSVFEHVGVIPGERMTFIASSFPYAFTPGLLTQRLEERDIKTQFMRDYYLNDRMSVSRMADAGAWLGMKGELSTDVRPRISLRALVFATTRAGMGFSKFMEALERVQGSFWLLVPAVFILGFVARKKFLSVTGAAAAGFSQMVFQVTTILLVQSVFGYAYALVGMLTAGFMLGAFLGVHYARYVRPADAAWIQAVLAVLFIAVLMFFPAGAFIFPILAGMAGGIQFAVYTTIAGKECGGRIYAADVLGAGCGALCAGVFLVPLWGMAMTMVFIAALNLVMGILLRSQPGSVSADL
jgi:spermidine synthase